MTSSEPRYVDHPAPSVVVVLLLLLSAVAMFVALPAIFQDTPEQWPLLVLFVAVALVIVAFVVWPLYKTYYTINAEGVRVEYGPWKRLHPRPDFSAAYWRKGMLVMLGHPMRVANNPFRQYAALKSDQGCSRLPGPHSTPPPPALIGW